MSETSPMHYAWIAAFFMPPIVLILDSSVMGHRLGLLRGALVSAVLILATVVGTAALYDRHLHAELAVFDRDGDGIFAGDEMTPDQERALSRVTNGLSRKLAPITSGVFGLVYSALVFGGAAAATGMWRRWRSAG